jgi:hypothetical protein
MRKLNVRGVGVFLRARLLVTASLLATALILAVGAAIPSSAIADMGPFVIRTVNGQQFFLGAPCTDAGCSPVQTAGTGRYLWFHDTGNDHNANVEGRIYFASTNYLASVTSGTNRCKLTTIKSSSSSDGVVWIEVDVPGTGIVLVNRYCDQQVGTTEYSERLGADNILGHRWGIGDSGLYTLILEVPV